jgi:hypothetical protein
VVLGWEVQFVIAIGTTIFLLCLMKIGDGEAQQEGWLVKSTKREAVERIKTNNFLKLSI